MERISVEKVIGNTDYNYKIITAGSRFALEPDRMVNVLYGGKVYPAKMHSKTVGRIDRMSSFYKESGLEIGDRIRLDYDPGLNCIMITKLAGSAEWGAEQAAEKAEEKKAPSRISGVLDTLDPVAVHQEYYFSVNARNTAVNRKWIFCNKLPLDGYLMDENGGHKTKLELPKECSFSSLCGMNNKGIWFMAWGDGYAWNGKSEWCNKIICYDFEADTHRVIRFNRKKAVLLKNPYIYENNIYYTASVSANKQEIVHIDETGTEHVLVSAHKREEVECICADSSRLVFRKTQHDAEGEEIDDSFYMLDLETSEVRRLGGASDFQDAIAIKRVDLRNNILWTTMTAWERAQYGKSGWIARPIGAVPEENRFLVWKKENKPAIFEISSCGYFDGRDAYHAPEYFSFERIDREGNRYLLKYGGHGAAQNFLVTDSYVYVNYDAITAVRLPRRFSSAKLSGEENPEAAKIFGNVDYRF